MILFIYILIGVINIIGLLYIQGSFKVKGKKRKGR
jgi:hypothetical protein